MTQPNYPWRGMDKATEQFRARIQQMIDSTLCVCGHRLNDHSRDDNIDNPDPGERCKCGCYDFRPTFYREGEK